MIQLKFLIKNKNSRAIKIYFDGFFFEYEIAINNKFAEANANKYKGGTIYDC
jgi:hypothetical protein